MLRKLNIWSTCFLSLHLHREEASILLQTKGWNIHCEWFTEFFSYFLSLLTSYLWKWCVPFLHPPLPGVVAYPLALEWHLGCFLLSIRQRHSVAECSWAVMLSISHSSSVSMTNCSGSAQGLEDKATDTVCSWCRNSSNTQAAVDKDVLSSGVLSTLVGRIALPQADIHKSQWQGYSEEWITMSIRCRWAAVESRIIKIIFAELNQLYVSHDSLFKLNLSAILHMLKMNVAFQYDQN